MEKSEIGAIEEDLKIDQNNLDFECMDQPKKYFRWSIEYADAIRSRDEFKRKATIVKSNINLDVRSRPEQYGLNNKPTVDSITAVVDSSEEVSTAEKEVSDAQYAVNIYGAAKEALDQRRAMLEKLVALYISGYYSQVKLGTEQIGKLADEATEHQKSLLRARRKVE